MKSYWSYREQSEIRSDSVISTVSLEHAIAGKDTDKKHHRYPKRQDITGICVEADAPEGWADVIILSGGKPIKDAEGMLSSNACMAKSPLH